MPVIRVLVVEDSLTVRARMVEVLSADPDLEVVGTASDGKRAIDLCLSLRPDVITLDMMLPVMSGLAVTEYIMAHCPTPILIVSASMNRGEVHKTYEALAAGAVDVLDKPKGNEPDGEWEARMVTALKLVSRIRVITHPRARLARYGRPLDATPYRSSEPSVRIPPALFAFGASTGGPGALVDILRALPAPLSVPVLIVLHINESFGAMFADWLDGQSPHQVITARDGDPLDKVSGKIVLAPPDRHLMVEGGRLRASSAPERHSCRPSVDVLFESLARDMGPQTVACLLTGMGRDGAQGLLALRRAGALTIAQDEASCVVFGMPREAIVLGAAERVLPLDQIGSSLSAFVSPPRRRSP